MVDSMRRAPITTLTWSLMAAETMGWRPCLMTISPAGASATMQVKEGRKIRQERQQIPRVEKIKSCIHIADLALGECSALVRLGVPAKRGSPVAPGAGRLCGNPQSGLRPPL